MSSTPLQPLDLVAIRVAQLDGDFVLGANTPPRANETAMWYTVREVLDDQLICTRYGEEDGLKTVVRYDQVIRTRRR